MIEPGKFRHLVRLYTKTYDSTGTWGTVSETWAAGDVKKCRVIPVSTLEKRENLGVTDPGPNYSENLWAVQMRFDKDVNTNQVMKILTHDDVIVNIREITPSEDRRSMTIKGFTDNTTGIT